MGHPHPPTPVVTDSSTRDGFVNYNIRKCRSRSIDIHFYWVRDRVIKLHHLVYWARGKENLANYLTKNHPTKHNHAIRITYIFPTANFRKYSFYHIPSDLLGCV